jgi:hypothetical protein
MKTSIAKLNEAKHLRDAALILLDRDGLDTILADRGTRYRTRQIEIAGLSIMHSRPAGEQLLDIWQGVKVFSVAWDVAGTLTVVAFRPGDWRQSLRAVPAACRTRAQRDGPAVRYRLSR